MINSDGKSQSYGHLKVFKKLVAKPRWPPKSPPKSIQTRIFIWPMLCESLKKKAVLVFSVSFCNRRAVDVRKNNNNSHRHRKQNRPRVLSVYNKKELDQNQESSPLMRWSLIKLHKKWSGQSYISKGAVMIRDKLTMNVPYLSICWYCSKDNTY